MIMAMTIKPKTCKQPNRFLSMLTVLLLSVVIGFIPPRCHVLPDFVMLHRGYPRSYKMPARLCQRHNRRFFFVFFRLLRTHPYTMEVYGGGLCVSIGFWPDKGRIVPMIRHGTIWCIHNRNKRHHLKRHDRFWKSISIRNENDRCGVCLISSCLISRSTCRVISVKTWTYGLSRQIRRWYGMISTACFRVVHCESSIYCDNLERESTA